MNVLTNRLIRKTWEKVAMELDSRRIGLAKIETEPKARALKLEVPAKVTRHPGAKLSQTLCFEMSCESDAKDVLNPMLVVRQFGFARQSSQEIFRQKVSLILGAEWGDVVGIGDAVEERALAAVAFDALSCISDVVVTGECHTGALGKLPLDKEIMGVCLGVRTRRAELTTKKVLEMDLQIGDDEIKRELDTLSDAWGESRDVIAALMEKNDQRVMKREHLEKLRLYLLDTVPGLMAKFACQGPQDVEVGTSVSPNLSLEIAGRELLQAHVVVVEGGFELEVECVPQREGLDAIEALGELARALNGLTPTKVTAHLAARKAKDLVDPTQSGGVDTSLELA